MNGKPAVAKGQQWPLSRGRELQQRLDRMRDEQEIKLLCGVCGCKVMYWGKFGIIRSMMDEHRKEQHPGWKAPKRKAVFVADESAAGDLRRAQGAV